MAGAAVGMWQQPAALHLPSMLHSLLTMHWGLACSANAAHHHMAMRFSGGSVTEHTSVYGLRFCASASIQLSHRALDLASVPARPFSGYLLARYLRIGLTLCNARSFGAKSAVQLCSAQAPSAAASQLANWRRHN
jgi:hypothetical protein